MLYNLVVHGENKNITVFHNGQMFVANEGHPNFDAIVAKVVADDEAAIDLFDLAVTVTKRFQRLGEQVSVSGETVYFDNEPVDNALTKQIIRFLNEGVEDFKPLVRFMEKIAANPSENSREQLYRFLQRHNFTIDSDGDIIAYKGIRDDLTSVTPGPAIVDGEEVDGHVPNHPGAVVEMARGTVVDNPGVACSVGLHAGTYSYARNFGRVVVTVKINPRDVVSVPFDSSDQKIRVCRYLVLEVVDGEHESGYVATKQDEAVEGETFLESYDGLEVGDLIRDEDGDESVVDRIDQGYGGLILIVTLSNGGGTWDYYEGDDELTLVAKAAPAVEEVPEKVDTRLNHLQQERYPKGHPKAGQFIPKSA